MIHANPPITMDRPQISVYIAMSIDGYIARKDNSLDWLDRVGGFDEDYGFKKHFESIDTLVIGRKTYEIATTVADPYPGKRVIVLSKTLHAVKEGMELYSGSLIELVSKLHASGARHIWVDGGNTISQFLALQMVDAMTLSIIPVVLGEGLPLFHIIPKEIPCRLISSHGYASGLVQLNYEVIKEFAKDQITFKIVDYGSDAYKKCVTLREEILRKPFGLTFSPEELEMEKGHVHVAGFLGQELAATAALVTKGDTLQMQRVATKPSLQNKGIGSLMMAFCEQYAHQRGIKSIYCHARDSATAFYLRNHYALEGEPFIENGIPHQTMRKILD